MPEGIGYGKKSKSKSRESNKQAFIEAMRKGSKSPVKKDKFDKPSIGDKVILGGLRAVRKLRRKKTVRTAAIDKAVGDVAHTEQYKRMRRKK